MRKCNDENQTLGGLTWKIVGGPLQPAEISSKFFRLAAKVIRSTKPCRIGVHIVKAKAVAMAHCSLFKIDLTCSKFWLPPKKCRLV